MDKEPIRILCVFSTLDRGGAESMCMNLYRNIDRSKVQFDFVKHTPEEGAFEDEILSLGGRIYAAPRFRLYNILEYRAWWKKHLREHNEHRIIHCHYFTLTSVISRVAKRYGRIVISHVHTSKADGRIKAFLQKSIEYNTDYRFACSDEAGKWLYPHKDYTVLNNALDTEKFAFDSSQREKHRIQLGVEDSFVIGTVANFSSVKNPFGLLDIFKTILAENPKTKLLWIGDGDLRPDIEQKITEEGLEKNVLLLGTRSDVPALLQAMDAFVLPSFYEGLPVVLIEAQAAGLPCFVSNTVTCEADITGLCHYLPLDDPKAWADAILNDHTPRENTTQKIIDAGYDIHTTAKWLQDFYLDLTDNTQ